MRRERVPSQCVVPVPTKDLSDFERIKVCQQSKKYLVKYSRINLTISPLSYGMCLGYLVLNISLQM